MKVLLDILGLKRPHRGANERFVAEGILAPLLPGMKVFNNTAGLPMAYVYSTSEESTTLFVAHLDTVHREDGLNPVIYDEDMEWMSKADGTPLGADDGAGVWLLYQMAKAGVPATYIFTVGEERGGVGAKWLVDNVRDFLGKFDRAIAFDRKGTHSIITHQSCERCCSDEFAIALAGQLTTTIPYDYEFKLDDGGVYTDTKEFTGIIPECTNISAGYNQEHTPNETLDVGYLKALLEACLKMNWAALPVARDPLTVEHTRFESDWMRPAGARLGHLEFSDLYAMTRAEIRALCADDPELVAEMLIAECLEEEAQEDAGVEHYDEMVWNKYYR